MVAWKNTVPGKDELYEAKREALLREAASAFNRQGFHATSLEDIAQRLGVTKAALYHYFPNKQTLLMACFRKAMTSRSAAWNARGAKARTGGRKCI